jgi:hypothetical protein
MDVMSMFDSRFMQAFHLVDKDGKARDFTLQIEKVEGGELMVAGGAKSRKPILYFHGAKRPLALNKTNARAISALYGRDVKRWVGRLVTLYPTTTRFGSDPDCPCIRVRPTIPKLGTPPPADREPDKEELERKAAAATSAAQETTDKRGPGTT